MSIGDYNQSMAIDPLMSGIIAAYTTFMGILGIIGIVVYVLRAIGLYTMAKNRELNNPWLAWIPIGNQYLLGELADPIFIGSQRINNVGLLNLLLPFAAIVLTFVVSLIPFLGILLAIGISIFLLVFRIYVTNRVIGTYSVDNATVLTVVAILIPYAEGIIYFVLRNNEPIDLQGGLKGISRGEYRESAYSNPEEDIYKMDENEENKPREFIKKDEIVDDPEDREGPGSGNY